MPEALNFNRLSRRRRRNNQSDRTVTSTIMGGVVSGLLLGVSMMLVFRFLRMRKSWDSRLNVDLWRRRTVVVRKRRMTKFRRRVRLQFLQDDFHRLLQLRIVALPNQCRVLLDFDIRTADSIRPTWHQQNN